MDPSNPETQDLMCIIQMHRLDLENLEQEAEAARQDGLATDADFAIEIFRDELRDLEAQLLDLTLSQRVGRGLDDEDQEISEAVSNINTDAQAAQVRKEALHQAITTEQCVICEDRYDRADLTKGLCEHGYCTACLQNLFEASLRDESIFPPRCCGEPFRLE